jgi:hypothetical protein
MKRPTWWKTIVVVSSFAALAAARPDDPKPKPSGQDSGEDLHPERVGGRGTDRSSGRRPADRQRFEPKPAKLSDWKVTAKKTETEEKNGLKTIRYTDDVKAEMTLPDGVKIQVEQQKLVVVANGDIPVKMDASGGIKATMPPRPGSFEADELSMAFDEKGWPTKISIPKQLRFNAEFGPIKASGSAVGLSMELKDNQPQKGSIRDVSLKSEGSAGPWSGGSARIKEIRGNRETDEIDFDGVDVQGAHLSGGFATKADHARIRSRRVRLFGNVTFSLGEDTFNADVVEFGEGEPIIESKDDKEILQKILKTVGFRG